MRALDLAEQVPLISWDDDAVTAVRMLAEHRLSGLVVADGDGIPTAVIPGPQLLRLVIPQYVLDDPALAHVYDESGATELLGRLRDHRLGELRARREIATHRVVSVLPEDTLMEIASAMCDESAPLVLVQDRSGGYHGVVTLARLTAAILQFGGEGTDAISRTLAVDLVDRLEQERRAGVDDADSGR